MLKIAWKRFVSSFHIHLFVIVQLSIVLSICLMMVSSVFSRFEYYLPLEKLMNQNASAVQLSYEVRTSDSPPRITAILFGDFDPLSKAFPDKAHTWYVCYQPLFAPLDNEKKTLGFLSYTENTWSLYEPKMKEGSWSGVLSSGRKENGNIPVIIYQYRTDYKIGDTIPVNAAITYENPVVSGNVNLEVCGILADDAMLFGGNSGNGVHNHTSFFQSPADSITDPNDNIEAVIFVMSQELIEKLGIAAQIWPGNGIITYDDTLTQKQVVINTERIHSLTGLPAENLASIKDFSLLYIMQQVFALLPLFICIAILALVSSICTSAVITKKNLRSYAIFQLCGAAVRKCTRISIIQEGLVSVASLLVAGGIVVAASKIAQLDINVNICSLLLCTAILVLHMFLTSMLSRHMLKTNSLKSSVQQR